MTEIVEVGVGEQVSIDLNGNVTRGGSDEPAEKVDDLPLEVKVLTERDKVIEADGVVYVWELQKGFFNAAAFKSGHSGNLFKGMGAGASVEDAVEDAKDWLSWQLDDDKPDPRKR